MLLRGPWRVRRPGRGPGTVPRPWPEAAPEGGDAVLVAPLRNPRAEADRSQGLSLGHGWRGHAVRIRYFARLGSCAGPTSGEPGTRTRRATRAGSHQL